MRTIFFVVMIILPGILLLGCQQHNNQAGPDTPEAKEALIHSIVGDHALMLKLIDEIKQNDHAKMMVTHMLGLNQDSTMDHANCPMMPEKNEAISLESHGATKSPYVGEEQRTIKSLSSEEIGKYLNGEGMGLAKAAELNNYPGPRHVLDLSSGLKLSENQISKGKELYADMHEHAVRLGKSIVGKEQLLDSLFSTGKITNERLSAATKELAVMQGELRATHLQAHIGMKGLLSPEQITKYVELRDTEK
jgi:hypothetical protein